MHIISFHSTFSFLTSVTETPVNKIQNIFIRLILFFPINKFLSPMIYNTFVFGICDCEYLYLIPVVDCVISHLMLLES